MCNIEFCSTNRTLRVMACVDIGVRVFGQRVGASQVSPIDATTISMHTGQSVWVPQAFITSKPTPPHAEGTQCLNDKFPSSWTGRLTLGTKLKQTRSEDVLVVFGR
jgi:hypothetical protein